MLQANRITKRTLTLGQPETINIPRLNAIREIEFNLKGSVTVSGGTTSGTVKDSSTARLITQISVRHPETGTTFQLPAQIIHRLNQFQYGARPAITEIPSGAAAANQAVQASFTIPFENLLGIKPFDTLLKGKGLSSLDMIVEVATSLSDFIQGGDRAIAVGTTPFTLEVTAIEEKLPDMESRVFAELRHSVIAAPAITAVNSQFQIKPIPTGMMWKGMLLYIEDAGVPSNAVINTITLKSGSEQIFPVVDGQTIQNQMKRFLALETWPVGFYYLNLMPDGRLNACLDTRKGTGRDELEILLDVNAPAGTCTVKVIGMQYYPLELLGRAKPAAALATK